MPPTVEITREAFPTIAFFNSWWDGEYTKAKKQVRRKTRNKIARKSRQANRRVLH